MPASADAGQKKSLIFRAVVFYRKASDHATAVQAQAGRPPVPDARNEAARSPAPVAGTKRGFGHGIHPLPTVLVNGC
jgi:hypothetical protein